MQQSQPDNHYYSRNVGFGKGPKKSFDQSFSDAIQKLQRSFSEQNPDVDPERLQQMKEEARPGSRLTFRKLSKPGEPGAADIELYGEGLKARTVKNEQL